MHHCCEAATISPKSLEMQPGTCSDRCASVPPALGTPIVALRYPWAHTLECSSLALSGGPTSSMEASSGPTGAVHPCPERYTSQTTDPMVGLSPDSLTAGSSLYGSSTCSHARAVKSNVDPLGTLSRPQPSPDPPVPGASHQAHFRPCPAGSVCCCGWDD